MIWGCFVPGLSTRVSTLVLILLLCARLVHADIVCDGVDDDLTSGVALSTFMSGTTGSMMLWYQPTGTPNWSNTTECFEGERTLGDFALVDGSYAGIYRHGNLNGNDRLCAYHWDGTEDRVEAAYTTNAWTHLAWVHSGGSLTFYKDGLSQGVVSSGTTALLTGNFRVCLGIADLQGNHPGQGVVAGVEIYNVEVSAAEIAAKATARLHRFGSTGRSGAWTLDSCATTGQGHAFYDSSHGGHPLTGDDGPNNAGLTCLANGVLTYPWGVE